MLRCVCALAGMWVCMKNCYWLIVGIIQIEIAIAIEIVCMLGCACALAGMWVNKKNPAEAGL